MTKVPDEVAESVALAYVGIVLRETLAREGISQRELAHRTGLSESRISQIIAGRNHSPTIRTIARIAHVLDLDLVIEFRRRER